jgi:hypothetical protein
MGHENRDSVSLLESLTKPHTMINKNTVSLGLSPSIPRLHLYIHDYLIKRGLCNTASSLHSEAQMLPSGQSDSKPPIDAPQGFLYEWWSIFWDMFSQTSGTRESWTTLKMDENHSALLQHQEAEGKFVAIFIPCWLKSGRRSLPTVRLTKFYL